MKMVMDPVLIKIKIVFEMKVKIGIKFKTNIQKFKIKNI
jgi:hypothetical protein